MSARRSSSRKSSGGIGCLIWIALLLVICLLFLVNKGKIEKVLTNTNFVNLWQNRGASPKPSPSLRPIPARSAQPSEAPRRSEGPKPTEENAPEPSPRASKAPQRSQKPEASSKPDKNPSPRPQESEKPRTRIATLSFVRVEDDGTILHREVKRSLPTSDSPLYDSLSALMKGPSADDLGKGLMSFIPQGAKVLSVVMRGSTAVVNVNEAFSFNSHGIEGVEAQLKQVVWTATAFPTVHDVQFLIEGKQTDYLGGEGVYIGLPLSRNSFGSL
jgi:germination protein M